jgi:cyanobactin maturation PatA/PatG family protease
LGDNYTIQHICWSQRFEAGAPAVSERDVASELISRLPGLDRLWAVTKGRPEVVVAILDGPVEASSVAPEHGLTRSSSAVEHGTHVYSIISGSADGLVPGLAPGCTALSIPIFAGASPGAQQICTQGELAAGIRAALQRRANIINISASQQADPLSLSADLSAALQAAAKADALVVAAAGNQGCACDTIPASVAGVLAVGAHGDAGSPLLSSNWGPGQRAQGIMAPGSNVPGACVGGGLCHATGTSFATAMVSGIAGLLMSADVERGVKPSGRRIRKLLLQSCAAAPPDQVEMASTHLAGRLDVARAVDLLLASSSPANTGEENVTIASSLATAATGTQSSPRIDIAPACAGDAKRAESSAAPAGGLVRADCGCGCGGVGGECTCAAAPKKTQLVYAIGRLGVSFVSQARRDSIWRLVNGKAEGDLKPITDQSLRELFEKQPFQAQSVVWTLSRTEVPMYVMVPAGAFAAETYKWMVEEWADQAVEFVSIPGVLAGQVALYDGQIVDAVIPDLRGMYSWETDRYVGAIRDARRRAVSGITDDRLDREVKRFLGKIYFSIRNRGATPEERALNAAATNAFNFSDVIQEAGADGMTLRDVTAERSPLNRPGSEYFDVLLTFFDPNDRQGRAPLRARFTIDVSDTVPVMIGDPVTWNEW